MKLVARVCHIRAMYNYMTIASFHLHLVGFLHWLFTPVVESIALESVETAVSDALIATSVSGTIDILTVTEDSIDSTYGTEKSESEVLAESEVPCDTSIDVADLDTEMPAEAAHHLEENVSELEASLVVCEDDIASANEDPADSADFIEPDTLQEIDNTMIGTAPTESSEDTEITSVGVESFVDASILDSAATLNANENLAESAETDESIADVGLSGQYSTSELESDTVLEDAPDLNRETEKEVELLSVAEEPLNTTAIADEEVPVDRDQLEYVDGASSAASTVPVTEPEDRIDDAEIPHDVDVSEIDSGDAGLVDKDFSIAETAETDEVPQVAFCSNCVNWGCLSWLFYFKFTEYFRCRKPMNQMYWIWKPRVTPKLFHLAVQLQQVSTLYLPVENLKFTDLNLN